MNYTLLYMSLFCFQYLYIPNLIHEGHILQVSLDST